MCISFIHCNCTEESCEYALIIATNRDESYKRPSSNASFWEDPCIFGGRDLAVGSKNGTWLAISPSRRKLGILLNISGNPKKPNAKSRGQIVGNFVKSDVSITEYSQQLTDVGKDCNEFIFIAIDFSKLPCTVYTFNNVNNKLEQWTNMYQGFSNSLPPLMMKKVQVGQNVFEKICKKHGNSEQKVLVNELTNLLKRDERHWPDPVIQNRKENNYKELSSIYVSIPEEYYGTRTHSLVFLTKCGTLHFIESTMQEPIDVKSPIWKINEFSQKLLII